MSGFMWFENLRISCSRCDREISCCDNEIYLEKKIQDWESLQGGLKGLGRCFIY